MNETLTVLARGLKEMATMGGRMSDETVAALDTVLSSDTGEEVERSQYDELKKRFDESDKVYDKDHADVIARLEKLESKKTGGQQ